MSEMSVVSVERSERYAAMYFYDFVVYSCYCSPNCSMDAFAFFLDGLETDIERRTNVAVVRVGGRDLSIGRGSY